MSELRPDILVDHSERCLPRTRDLYCQHEHIGSVVCDSPRSALAGSAQAVDSWISSTFIHSCAAISAIEQIIANMQRSITVDVANPGGGRLSAFTIAFHGRNPREVAKVTNELARLFIQENLKVLDQQSDGTADFLTNQLADMKKQVDAKQQEIQEVQSRYIHQDLPESQTISFADRSPICKTSFAPAKTSCVRKLQQQKRYCCNPCSWRITHLRST